MTRTRATTLIAGTALAVILGSASAQAQEGPGLLGTLFMNMLGSGSTDPGIDYRERAPLVVPPRSSLPAPQQRASERTGNWPTDPDVQRRRDAENQGIFDGFIGRPRAQADGPRQRLSPAEIAEGRIPGRALESREPVGGTEAAALSDNANTMLRIPQQQMRAADTNRARQIAEEPVGREPPRRFLTDPPQGLRSATQRVAPAPERPIDRSDDLGVRQFQRQQSNR
jgi:hypothetical protein